MSEYFAITTLIELAVASLLLYGFMHEDKLIAFEQAVVRIVLGNYRRSKRILKPKVKRLRKNIRRIVVGNYRRLKRIIENTEIIVYTEV